MLTLTAAAALFCAGCAAPDAETAGPAPGSSVVASSPAGTSGSPAPAPSGSGERLAAPEILRFTAPTVQGGTFDGTSVAGRPVVLWFWASWCPTCRAAAPGVRDLQRDLAGQVEVVGVAGLSSGAPGMRDFVDGYDLDGFPQLADDAGEVWRRFSVTQQSYYVVLDASGAEVARGPMTVDELRRTAGGLA